MEISRFGYESLIWHFLCMTSCMLSKMMLSKMHMHSVLLPFMLSDSKQLVEQYTVLITEGETLSSIHQFRLSIRLLIYFDP